MYHGSGGSRRPLTPRARFHSQTNLQTIDGGQILRRDREYESSSKHGQMYTVLCVCIGM